MSRTYLNIISKYFSVGLIATLIHSLVYSCLIFFYEIHPQSANLISYLSAVLFSYYFQMKWTFSDRQTVNSLSSFNKFFASSLFGFILNVTFVFIVNNVLNMNPLYALFGIMIFTPSINFLILNFWDFPKK